MLWDTSDPWRGSSPHQGILQRFKSAILKGFWDTGTVEEEGRHGVQVSSCIIHGPRSLPVYKP